MTIRYGKIEFSGTGDATVVAAIAGKKIRVITYFFSIDTAMSIQWKSGATALTGAIAIPAGGNLSCGNVESLPGGLVGVLETAAGEALILNLDAAGVVGGHLVYSEITV